MTQDAEIKMLRARVAELELKLVEAAAYGEKVIPVAKIAAMVSENTLVPLIEIRSNRRFLRQMLARHLVMYLARKHTTLSLPAIGKYLRRDHTTVMSGIRRIEGLLDSDPKIKVLVDSISKKIEESHNSTESIGPNWRLFPSPGERELLRLYGTA